MKQFTRFTLLYVAIGVCFTILAFHQTKSSLVFSMLLTAGLAYFQTLLSLLPRWRQRQLRIQAKLRYYPRWQQVLINFWVAIVLMIILLINLVTNSFSLQIIPSIGVLLIVVIIILESLWVSRQLN